MGVFPHRIIWHKYSIFFKKQKNVVNKGLLYFSIGIAARYAGDISKHQEWEGTSMKREWLQDFDTGLAVRGEPGMLVVEFCHQIINPVYVTNFNFLNGAELFGDRQDGHFF
jgi:hypothetical protein